MVSNFVFFLFLLRTGDEGSSSFSSPGSKLGAFESFDVNCPTNDATLSCYDELGVLTPDVSGKGSGVVTVRSYGKLFFTCLSWITS